MLLVFIFLTVQLLISYLIIDFIPNQEAYGLIMLLIGITAVSFYLYRSLDRAWLIVIFTGFVLRITTLLIDLYVPSITVFSSGADTEMFHKSSLAIAEGTLPISEGITAYVPFLSIIYFLGGDQRPFAQFLNIVFWVFAAVFLLKSMQRLNVELKLTYIALLIFTFMPTGIVMSSILLRESIIVFFISISLYQFICWFTGSNIGAFLQAAGWALAASVFHSGMIGFLIAYLLAYQLVEKPIKSQRSSAIVYSLFTLLIFFIVLQNGDLFLGKFRALEEGGVSGVEISARGGSMYLENLDGLNGVAALAVAPIKMLYFLLSPMPFDWRGFGDMASFASDSSVYLFLIIGIIWGLWNSDMPVRNKLFLFLFVSLTVLIYAYGTQNAGTAMRHRNKIVPLFLIVFVLTNSKQFLSIRRHSRIQEKGEKLA
ncbi:phospholipid carrier-dependent glycosyltransferase [Indiicoccus explosivorum]|uniref:phospholipid carrier-dependent glycosyltransferase n=1 Tax=Indiicoccus explosivorum TaxID=1917864 RepID=UPI000B44D6DE|nr:phospholipid carrier-dependent glycosyltransferase [Indiicoccus explosivorum]